LNLISGKGSREVCLLRLENIAVLWLWIRAHD
jgi:hypothetical protein